MTLTFAGLSDWVEHRRSWLPWLVLIVAIIVRLAYIGASSEDYTASPIDPDGYARIASRLLNEGKLAYPGAGRPTARVMPGYPLFIAFWYLVLGERPELVLIPNALLDVITCGLVFLIGRRLFQRDAAALLAALGYALYLPEIYLLTHLWSEPLFTTVLAAHTYCLIVALDTNKWKRWLLSGLTLGMATLVRPTTQLYLLVVVLVIMLVGRGRRTARLRSLALLVVSCATMLAPWVARNYVQFGAFIPTTTKGGYMLYYGNYGLPRDDYLVEWSDRELKDYIAASGMSEIEVDRWSRRKAIETVSQYPLRFTILSLVRLLRFWFNIGYGHPPTLLSLGALAWNGSLLGLMAAAYIWHRDSWVTLYWPVLALIGTVVGTHLISHGLIRYSFPIIPYVLLPAAYVVAKVAPTYGHNREARSFRA